MRISLLETGVTLCWLASIGCYLLAQPGFNLLSKACLALAAAGLLLIVIDQATDGAVRAIRFSIGKPAGPNYRGYRVDVFEEQDEKKAIWSYDIEVESPEVNGPRLLIRPKAGGDIYISGLPPKVAVAWPYSKSYSVHGEPEAFVTEMFKALDFAKLKHLFEYKEGMWDLDTVELDSGVLEAKGDSDSKEPVDRLRKQALADAMCDFMDVIVKVRRKEGVEEAAARSKGESICPKCGAAETQDAEFCDQCGASLSA